MKHYIAVLTENKAGALARISGLFAQHGFNIDSLALGEADDPAVSRITIVVDGDDDIVEQVTKQLAKLEEIKTVKRIDPRFMIHRDLVLIKVKIDAEQRGEIYDLAKIMGCDVVDLSHTTLMLKSDDRTPRVDLLIELLSEYEILEIARAGTIALQKGEGTVYDDE